MKKQLIYLFAITFTFSAIGCNSNSNSEPAQTDSNSHQQVQKDSISRQEDSTTDEASITGTSGQPATPGEKVDGSDFHKVLSFKKFSFTIKAEGKGSLQQLTIKPSGLSVSNPPVNLEVDPIVDAKVADLNSDGFPELLIFTQSAGSGSYGDVVAYSVNNGKSISRVTFSPSSENRRIHKGYMGHDSFEVINNQLVQTIPIFAKGDANSDRKGKKRVVTYKMINGEASRIFEVDKVTEL